MAEAAPGHHLRRPARDPTLLRNAVAPRLAPVPRCPLPPCPVQAQVELLRPPFDAMHMPVDRLVGQSLDCFPVCPVCPVCLSQPEPPGNLLRRPAGP